MPLCQTTVLKVYHAVIEDVISNVRDAFLDEGVDEQVLQEMRQIWRTKLMASKAVEESLAAPYVQPPQIIVNNPKPTKAQTAKAKKAAAAAAAASVSQQAQNNNSNNNNNGSIQNSTSTVGIIATNTDIKSNIGALHQVAITGNAVMNSTNNNTSNGSNNSTGNDNGGSNPSTTMNGTMKQESQQQINTSTTSIASLQQQKLQSQSLMMNSNQQQHPTTSNNATNSQQSSSIPMVASLDPNRIMPVNITLPAQSGSMNTESRVLTIHVPASALQENQLTQILTAHLISSIMSLPTTLASSVLQQHVNAALINANIEKNTFNTSKQMDGAADTSDDDESEETDENVDDDENDDMDKDDDEDLDNEGGAEEEPLNSEDDVTDEDASDLFDTENVIVCQYDKITRSRNKWKFYLKDGIMNIGGKDYIFQKSNGDAEW